MFNRLRELDETLAARVGILLEGRTFGGPKTAHTIRERRLVLTRNESRFHTLRFFILFPIVPTTRSN
jgi:hypothetical protein